MGLLMPAVAAWIIWQMIVPHGTLIWLWAAPLAAFVFGLPTFLFLSYSKDFLKDIRTGLTDIVGNVRDKRILRESTPYGLIIYHYIAINEKKFKVTPKLYNWLSTGEEVLIKYWPNTGKLCKVDKLHHY